MNGVVSRARASLAASDRVLVGFALAAVGWLVMYAALTVAGMDSPELARFVGEVLYLVPIATAAALSFNAVRHTKRRVRGAWWLLFGSNVLWFAGEATWAVQAYTSPGGPPVPSLADVFYLMSYLLAMPAIMLGLGLKVRGLLDALLVAAGGAAIGWQMIIGPLVPSTWNAAALVTFLYPVFAVSIVSVLIAVLLSGSQRVPRSMILVGFAFGLAAMLDAGYAYLSVLHEYTSSSWLNLGWQAEALLLGYAALLAARRPDHDERRLLTPDMSFLPALVAVLTVGGLALADMILVGQIGRVTLAVTMLLLVGLLVRQIVATRDRARLNQRLRTAAITDSLTGLYNRRFFEEMLAIEADGAARRRAPLSLILIDLDHFKEVNDTHGHVVGDAVLAEVADRLRRALRGSDLVCRYGGEEFVCLLPRAEGQAAMDLAERIRAELHRTPVTVAVGTEPLALTASFGVASADPTGGQIDAEGLVTAADRALYRAKALGRDRVVGSGLFAQVEVDPAADLPPGLVWMADQIDRVRGDGQRSATVCRWAWKTAGRMGLDEAAQRRTAAAARVHDIGRIGGAYLPPEDILDPQARDDARGHPDEGARLLVEFAHRPDLAPLIAAHHERYDGSGYPRGLAGADIPVGARIIAVCDAWATIRGNGVFPSTPSLPQARHELTEGRGTHFDPAVLDAFLALVDEGAIDESGPGLRPGAGAAGRSHIAGER